MKYFCCFNVCTVTGGYLPRLPAPGLTIPLLQSNATLHHQSFAQPSLEPRMESLLTSYFTFLSPPNFILGHFSYQFSSTRRLHLNPRPVIGRLLSRQSALLIIRHFISLEPAFWATLPLYTLLLSNKKYIYSFKLSPTASTYCAVQPCSCRVELHIQIVDIVYCTVP